MSVALVGISVHMILLNCIPNSAMMIFYIYGFVIDLAFKKCKYKFLSVDDTSGSWSN